jgi:hypothetical protein
LWRELAEEIACSLRDDGARVRSEWGEWGREVQAGSNGALSRFIGVDGPRWMLYGVATGPAEGAAELASTLREMIRATVVTRGADPLPVKTVLPLKLPEHLEDRVEEARHYSAQRPAADTAVESQPSGADPVDLAPDHDSLADTSPGVAWPTGDARRDAVPPVPPRPGYRPSAAEHRPPPRHHGPPRPDLGISSSQPNRSIGGLGPDSRPDFGVAPAREPDPPPARPGHSALPPVPAYTEWDTDGFPVPLVESTWSMAIPVVSADAVEHQPAWAQLTDAPSFWPDPYPEGRSPVPPPPAEPERAPEPEWSAGPEWAAQPADEPVAFIPPDPLHDALTSDAALSQDRLPRVERRGRHRRPD